MKHNAVDAMQGLHLIADLHDCSCPATWLLDSSALEDWCVAACSDHGLTVVGSLFHQFTDTAGRPAGLTGAVILAESHLAIHTWPEIAAVTLDIYVCNFSADNSAAARTLGDAVIVRFAPQRLEKKEVARGHLSI